MEENKILTTALPLLRQAAQRISDRLGIQFELKGWGPDIGGTMGRGEMRRELFPLEIEWPSGQDESLSYHLGDLNHYIAGDPTVTHKLEEELRTHLERLANK